jgi:hypothetical protein
MERPSLARLPTRIEREKTSMSPESSNGPGSRDPRRSEPRMPVVLAVELSSKAKPGRCGVTRNASGKGLLIVTPSRFSVGDELDLSVHVGTQRGRVAAKVVRVEENGKDSVEVWRYRLAVQLDDTLPDDLLEEARSRAPVSGDTH